MIKTLTGKIIPTTAGVIVDINGVGYFVHTTSRDQQTAEKAKYYTYLAVRETALDLYGFLNEDERSCFELLLSVPKIGPKSALQILEQTELSTLAEAIATEDASVLTKISGLGKKTAEAIVHNLKDKMDPTLYQLMSGAGDTVSNYDQDAFDALVALGYNPQSIRDVLKNAPKDLETSALVKYGLKNL
ncbi:Holliday junction branch migration protein RuvA [Candidatus Kaiserbacteria bacterium]|nr:Holliday junction branch migration protein RuvA [Candidatus Kaiserbacteria bacterium]